MSLFDPYLTIGPYYDITAARHRAALRDPLLSLVGAAERGVLEIGSGTGLITEMLAQSVTGEVYAVEPSAAMRTALVSRLVANPAIQAKVTVIPHDALKVDLPAPVDAALLMAVLYAFPPDDRRALWRLIRRQLHPGGRLIIEPPWPGAAEPVAATPLGGATIGRYRYEIVWEAEVVGPGELRGTDVLRTFQEGVLVAEERADHAYYPVAIESLEAELSHAGFARAASAEGLLVWRKETR